MPLFADYIKNTVYTGTDGDNGLYLHDGSGSYTNASEEAGDNSYRYAGANPNNYVCFGSDEATCSADNLYRIIGIFDNQIKLIKNTSLGNYYWSGSSSNQSNTWSSSTLNTGTLNGTYLNGLGTTWSDMIETTTWKVGGMTYNTTYTVKQYYVRELGSSSSNTTYSAKIGLMYVTDYGYASTPTNWSMSLYNYGLTANILNNWLYFGNNEWTITRYTNNLDSVFRITNLGIVGTITLEYSWNVRPTFYLKSNVVITSGDGTSTNPYRLALN